MFERFTEGARQVVVLAQDEARGLKHDSIGTEHLLLGLLRNEERLAARVLTSLGVTLEGARAVVIEIDGEGEERPTGQIPFTANAKKVLELSLREALSLGHNYIGTEHILLGVVRQSGGEDEAAQVLRRFDVDTEKVRDELIKKISGPRPGAGIRAAAAAGARPRKDVGGWEYRVEKWPSPEDTQHRAARLAELGADRWQLAAIVPGDDGCSEWVFQRPARLHPAWTSGFGNDAEDLRHLTIAEVEARLLAAQVAEPANADSIGGIMRRLAELVETVSGSDTSLEGLSCGAFVELLTSAKDSATERQEPEEAVEARKLERKLVALLREVDGVLKGPVD